MNKHGCITWKVYEKMGFKRSDDLDFMRGEGSFYGQIISFIQNEPRRISFSVALDNFLIIRTLYDPLQINSYQIIGSIKKMGKIFATLSPR